MVDFLDRDRRSNLVLPSRFRQFNKPPRQPNFAQNMNPNKRCRRSLARPNRTTPEYHDVDHGVAVGWPRRFCVIAPIAFVGGMGGWCCRCAVVCVCLWLPVPGGSCNYAISIATSSPQESPPHMRYPVVLPLRSPWGAFRRGFQQVPRSLDSVTRSDVTT
jgi:hypothetical protein